MPTPMYSRRPTMPPGDNSDDDDDDNEEDHDDNGNDIQSWWAGLLIGLLVTAAVISAAVVITVCVFKHRKARVAAHAEKVVCDAPPPYTISNGSHDKEDKKMAPPPYSIDMSPPKYKRDTPLTGYNYPTDDSFKEVPLN